MWFILGLLGTICGFIVILLVIYIFIRGMLNKHGFSGKSLMSIYNDIKKRKEMEENAHRQIGGMTKVLLPLIQEDFPDFNENNFYFQVEKLIRTILSAIEKKDINKLLKDKDYSLINEKTRLQIEDLEVSNKKYVYDDIVFHKHVIKSYTKKASVITLCIASALEYYYEEYHENKIIYKKDSKRQARCTTTFIYIIDTQDAGFDIGVLGINCPNCGAVITSLKQDTCKYCKTGLNIVVGDYLKCWKIIDYKIKF